jgi:hypothetical protein
MFKTKITITIETLQLSKKMRKIAAAATRRTLSEDSGDPENLDLKTG